MLEWLRRMLTPPASAQALDGELHAARKVHERVTKRADRIIAEAFRHADAAAYAGPERRARGRS